MGISCLAEALERLIFIVTAKERMERKIFVSFCGYDFS